MTNKEITAALKANHDRRARTEAKLRELRRAADDLIVEGDKAGVPKLQLSEAAGLTRQTVYSILLRAKAGV